MSFILLTSITIGLFAFGGALYLMWRQRDWRIAFLAAMAAVVILRETAALLGAPLTWTISFPGPNQDLPGLIVSIMVWVSVFFLERMIRERRQAEEGLKRAQEELHEAYGIIKNQKDRMEDELNIGRDIQMSMVPLTFPPFPNRKEFSIYATLQPAREIGGDFYDFFFVDEERLCFCIGDVSGKGVPAALYMAVTKTLIKSRAADDLSTASILTHVNDELSRDNPNAMFVTIFIGILNTRSGEFDYSNAGHNPPYLRRRDGSSQKLGLHGPVVGAMDGIVYGKGTEVLRPGDLLYMYTDGVTEEMDTNGQLFSDERLEELICSPTIDSVETAVDNTVSAVKSFRGEKDAEDDVTILAIQFHGDSAKLPMEGLHVIVRNELSQIATVDARFREFAEERGFPEDLKHKMSVIIDDLLNNVISHAFPEGGEHEIEVRAEQVGNRLTVTITDDGIPFNPLLSDTPDISLTLEDREVGGFGILLVGKMADDISYHRRIDKNVLTLVIHVDQSDDAS
ncbi:MAG: SpoIIE family protein phosphatase [Proteobacteria bacterium]|nr:SpoIIE family protein phosphatase [Pseudomonadota bacterium]